MLLCFVDFQRITHGEQKIICVFCGLWQDGVVRETQHTTHNTMKIDHLNITLTNAELTALLTVLRDHQNAKTATDVLFWARKTGNWANVTNYADWNVLANLPVSNLELWPIMLHLDEQVKNGLELPKWALTKAQINRAIAHTGLSIQGNRSDGYFYFLNAEGHQVGESVMVCYLRQLPLHRWVRLAENALVPTNCFLHYAKTIG